MERTRRFWLTAALCCAFAALGILFIAAPRTGAAVFGIAPGEAALPYLRALGSRDVALAIYVGGLLLVSDVAGLRLVLLGSLINPAVDLALVAATSGVSSWPNLALHATGALCLAALGWSWRAPISGGARAPEAGQVAGRRPDMSG